MTTAGFAHTDITPPIGTAMRGYAAREHPSQGVLDPLYARAMVLESAGERVAVVGVDVACIQSEIIREARATAARETGIPEEAITISATHTHWGPALQAVGYIPDALRETVRPQYAEQLAHQIAMSIALADRRREPARVGVGVGWNPLISFNRRPLDADGQCQMRLRVERDVAEWAAAEGARQAVEALTSTGIGATPLRPAPGRPEGEGGELRWGPTDPEVPIIRVEGESGTLGGVVSFACHAVCGDAEDTFYDLSADYPGAMQEALRGMLGAEVVFTSGCAGNQVPVMRGEGSRRRIGRSLAAEVARVWDSIRLEDELTLKAVRKTVELPIKDFSKIEPPQGEDSQARFVRWLVETHAGSTHIESEVQALRIGGMGIVALPGETFVEIGHAIKATSPLSLTMPISLAADDIGYVTTRAAHDEGGYEPTWNIAAPGAGEVVVDQALRVLERVV